MSELTIVTTTINHPTEATIKFCCLAKLRNWQFVIVGDQKTPHKLYEQLVEDYSPAVTYLSPETQESLYPELSKLLGWKTIQRRNIGFVFAYNETNAAVIATVDDDNIPFDNWGQNLLVGNSVTVDVYKNRLCGYFDPFSVTNQKHLWHRGFPIEYLEVKNSIDLIGRKSVYVAAQADFWMGDPDIDSICRLTQKPLVKFDHFDPFTTFQPAPFNSQNTFICRSHIKRYSVWPDVGRMDDIWAGYHFRELLSANEAIVYCPASVYQERNPQDLVKNLENECIGYRHTKEFIDQHSSASCKFVPDKVLKFLDVYQSSFN